VSEALVFAALVATGVLVVEWLDDIRQRRDARRRNQARPRGWR
jgi:hypothetical protein